MQPPVVVVHGGAWSVPDEKARDVLSGVKKAARLAYKSLQNNESCVDAVEKAVAHLEDDPNFDAGKGSELNTDGGIEMHSIVMRGEDLQCGGVIGVQTIKNPVKAARIVMEKSNHCLLDANATLKIARQHGLEEKDIEYFATDENKLALENTKKYPSAIKQFFDNESHDTVGAVALDIKGNIACATSTGGICAQQPGRVSDSPCPGAGGFADNASAAVSTTGHGEAILRVSLARLVSFHAEQGNDLQTAVEKSLGIMQGKVKGYGGAIALSKEGDVGVHFTTKRMAWAVIGVENFKTNTTSRKNTSCFFGIEPEEIQIEYF